jgi:hypothetical protein
MGRIVVEWSASFCELTGKTYFAAAAPGSALLQRLDYHHYAIGLC